MGWAYRGVKESNGNRVPGGRLTVGIAAGLAAGRATDLVVGLAEVTWNGSCRGSWCGSGCGSRRGSCHWIYRRRSCRASCRGSCRGSYHGACRLHCCRACHGMFIASTPIASAETTVVRLTADGNPRDLSRHTARATQKSQIMCISAMPRIFF